MAGISKISELEARKRALVTESEICREAFKAEIDNLRLHAGNFFHTFDRVRSIGTWLMLAGPVAVPLLSFLFRKNTSEQPQPAKFKGRIATALLALKLYRKYGPLVRSAVRHFKTRRRSTAEAR